VSSAIARASFTGPSNEPWFYHTVIVKDEKGYDQYTNGMPIAEWKKQWGDLAEEIDFDSKDDEFLEFVRAARRRIGAFTWYGTLPEAFALVMGYFNGHNKAMLRDFQDWVGRRCGRPELAFVVHALNEALPERNDASATRNGGPRRRSGWPRKRERDAGTDPGGDRTRRESPGGLRPSTT